MRTRTFTRNEVVLLCRLYPSILQIALSVSALRNLLNGCRAYLIAWINYNLFNQVFLIWHLGFWLFALVDSIVISTTAAKPVRTEVIILLG